MDDLHVIFYNALNNELFQSGYLEGLFCALEIRPGFWTENPHIDIIGLL